MNWRRWSLILLVAAGALGGWMALRNRPAPLPTPIPEALCVVHPLETGFQYRLVPGKEALRSLHWVGGQQSEELLLHVVTQTDRHRITFFKRHGVDGQVDLHRPAAIPENQWRLLELQGAYPLDGPQWMLFLAPPRGRTQDPAWCLFVDRSKQSLLQILPVAGHRATVRLGPGQLHACFWNDSGELTQITWKAGGAPALSKPVPFPAEAGSPRVALLDAAGILWMGTPQQLWQRDGDAWRSVVDTVPVSFLKFPQSRPQLVQTRTQIWFQPTPGAFFVRDSTTDGSFQPRTLSLEGPEAQDAALLSLLGTTADGTLWFELAVPRIPALNVQKKDATPEEAGAASSWSSYLAQPLNRRYTLTPGATDLMQTAPPQAPSKEHPGGSTVLEEPSLLLPSGLFIQGEPHNLRVTPCKGPMRQSLSNQPK